MTPELAAKVRALSPDAKVLLATLANDDRQFRSMDDLWGYTGIGFERLRCAARELGPLVCSLHTRTVPEHGVLARQDQARLLLQALREAEPALPLGEETALLAAAAREAEPGLPMEEGDAA